MDVKSAAPFVYQNAPGLDRDLSNRSANDRKAVDATSLASENTKSAEQTELRSQRINPVNESEKRTNAQRRRENEDKPNPDPLTQASREIEVAASELSRLVIDQEAPASTKTFLDVAKPQDDFRLIDIYV